MVLQARLLRNSAACQYNVSVFATATKITLSRTRGLYKQLERLGFSFNEELREAAKDVGSRTNVIDRL